MIGIDLAKIIIKAILLLENAGVQIMGITSDGASTNRTLWGILGVCGKMEDFKNTFQNPFDNTREVFVFSDAPHLLKTVRNRLYEKKILRVSVFYSFILIRKDTCLGNSFVPISDITLNA